MNSRFSIVGMMVFVGLVADEAANWKLVGVQSLVYSLPQWLGALVGGLLSWGAATIRSRRLTKGSPDGQITLEQGVISS